MVHQFVCFLALAIYWAAVLIYHSSHSHFPVPRIANQCLYIHNMLLSMIGWDNANLWLQDSARADLKVLSKLTWSEALFSCLEYLWRNTERVWWSPPCYQWYVGPTPMYRPVFPLCSVSMPFSETQPLEGRASSYSSNFFFFFLSSSSKVPKPSLLSTLAREIRCLQAFKRSPIMTESLMEGWLSGSVKWTFPFSAPCSPAPCRWLHSL